MSFFERASNDLRAGRVELQKLGLTFTDFQSHCFSIISLGEQWNNLQKSLSTVHSSLENRVKEIESKEREITAISNKFEILQKQVALRQKTLDFGEKSLSERTESVEIREKQVKEWFESLNLAKKNFSDHCKAVVQLTNKRFSEGFERLGKVEERENEVAKREEACCAREKELEAKLMMMSEKSEGLTMREEELNVREKKLNEFYEDMKLKEGDMNTKEVKLGEFRKKLELKEIELNELYNAVQLNEKKVQEKGNMLSLREKEIESLCREVEAKEKELNEELEELKVNEKELNEKLEELKVKEKELNEKLEELKVKEKELNEKLEELKVKEKQLNDSCDVLELHGKKVDEQLQTMEVKEKEVDELRQVLTLKEMQLNEDRKALDLKEKRADDRSKEAGKKMKQAIEIRHKQNLEFCKAERKINGLSKELKLKEKEPNEHYEIKESKEKQVSEHCSGVVLESSNNGVDLPTMCKNMDAEGVRSYLIVRVEEQKSLNEKMLDALKCAPDPAKLALDVFRNFHTKFKNKYHSRANKKSCIFVLEQMMKLSPPIAYEVKVEAKEFAAFCNSGFKGNACPVDSFGFLLLLATFKLANLYSADDLLTRFNVFYAGGDIYRLEENSYLCNALGLLDKIPALVSSLIERKKRLLAIKYICVFKLECDFPVVPLLEAQLAHIKDRVKDKRKGGTFKSKYEADDMELSSLSDLIKYITVFKLESKFSIDSLLSRVNKLGTEKRARGANAAAPTKKRNADLCASEALSNQLEKRQRVGDVHQVAPLDTTPCQPSMPHTLGHATHTNPNVQPTWQQATIATSNGLSYGVGPHLGYNMPFEPPGMYPLGASGPFY